MVKNYACNVKQNSPTHYAGMLNVLISVELLCKRIYPVKNYGPYPIRREEEIRAGMINIYPLR